MECEKCRTTADSPCRLSHRLRLPGTQLANRALFVNDFAIRFAEICLPDRTAHTRALDVGEIAQNALVARDASKCSANTKRGTERRRESGRCIFPSRFATEIEANSSCECRSQRKRAFPRPGDGAKGTTSDCKNTGEELVSSAVSRSTFLLLAFRTFSAARSN